LLIYLFLFSLRLIYSAIANNLERVRSGQEGSLRVYSLNLSRIYTK